MADDQAPGDSHGAFYADSSDPVFWSVGKFVVGLSIGCGSDFAWMGSVYCNDDHDGDGGGYGVGFLVALFGDAHAGCARAGCGRGGDGWGSDGSGVLEETFVWGTRGNVPDEMVAHGQVYRILADARGSVRLVVDAGTGQVMQALRYSPWGRVMGDTDPGFQPFGYAGGLDDRRTGLERFGVRDYDPGTGRWIEPDPILFAGGANLYAYADNDPINFIDPSGLYCLSNRAILAISGAIGGALAGAAATSETGPGAVGGEAGGLVTYGL